MKKTTALLASLAFAGVIFTISSCSKTGDTGATGATGAPGSPGPVLSGAISGYVLLYDQYGNPVTTNLQASYVLLYNTATGARVDSVYADSIGQYNIPNVTTGTYNMTCKAPGFGNCVHQNLEFTAATLTVDNKLSAIPNFNVSTIDSLGLTVRGTTLNIYGKILSDTRQRTLIIFAGNSASVSANPSTYTFISTQTVAADSGSYDVKIALNTIYGNGYASGSTVYFAIYGAANQYQNGDFTDFPSGKVVYTAISLTPFIPIPSYILP